MIQKTTIRVIQKALSLVGYKLTPLKTNPISQARTLANQRFQQTAYELQKNPELKADDVFVVSYASSGMALVRKVLAHILYSQEKIDALRDSDQLIPEIHKGIPTHNEYSFPRVIKTHEPFPFRHDRQNITLYSKVIYIVRHPFDVIRSYYRVKLATNPKISLDEIMYTVMLGDINWGSWQEHVLSWKAREEESEIIFIRYEDFLQKPIETIGNLASFLGVSLTPEQAEQISNKCSLGSWGEKKLSDSDKHPELSVTRRDEDKELMKNALTPEMKIFIKECCGFTMKLFDYGVND